VLRYQDGYDASKGDPAAWLMGSRAAAWSQAGWGGCAVVPEDEPRPRTLGEETARRLTLTAAIATLEESGVRDQRR
jgi:hypothetical protein